MVLIVIFDLLFASNETTLEEEESLAKKLTPDHAIYDSINEANKIIDGYGKDWIGMPDGSGKPVMSRMDLNETQLATSRSAFNDDSLIHQINLYLFTHEHPDGRIFHLKDLDYSGINPAKPFKFICHGWMSSTNSSIVKEIKEAYLKENHYNVIGVDWHFFAKNIYYPTAAGLTRVVGHYVGFVINILVRHFRLSYDDFHIIGHSLGAHVAGFAGSFTKHKVGRITGLDPALPSFQYVRGHTGRLDSTDAKFVDVIHTCAGVLGMTIPAGHADFYPNGGTPFQPGCHKTINPLDTQACSHIRSYSYFAESIENPNGFQAVKCFDWNHFRRHLCKKDIEVMGEGVSRKAHGIYYLTTNSESPYAKGESGTRY